MEVDASEIRKRLDAVVAAMKQAKLWDVPEPASVVVTSAFGGDAMSFEQWLRFVFVPSVEARLAENGPWPEGSAVAVRATREADVVPGLDVVVGALRDFDELFQPATPETLMARAKVLHGEGKSAEAIAAAEAAAKANDGFPNAHNYAGWLIVQQPNADADALERALRHFVRAIELAPGDAAPTANYGDLLIRLGREEEAFAWMEARVAQPRERAAVAHNWLGWWRTQRGKLDLAIENLRSAVKLRPTWGTARINLGTALENAKRSDEMYDVFDPKHAFDNGVQRAFAHERRGAYEARKGWLRSALASFRRAIVEGEAANGKRVADAREGERYLAAMLHAHALWAPSFDLERRWIAAKRDDLPPTRREAEAALIAAMETSDGEARAVLEDELLPHVRGTAGLRGPKAESLARWTNDPNVGRAVQTFERWLAARWTRLATAEIPPERVMLGEDGKPLPEALCEAERKARAGAYAEAATLLEAARPSWVDAIGIAERAGDEALDAGDEATAQRLYAIALAGAREYASWATSGGEGLARMVDVNRLAGKVR